MIELFDVHCHLQDASFDGDRGEAVARAKKAGVRAVLAVSEDAADARRVLEIAREYPDFVAPAAGVHPDRAPDLSDSGVAEVLDLVARRAGELCAVGEIGLDYRPRWDERARARQREVFAAMLDAARRADLPVSVHSRGAGRHAVDFLLERGFTRACLHAFDGRAVHVERGAAAGLFFSLPPAMVRLRVMEKWARRIPLDRMLLESDSPVLGPSPDARNEPGNIASLLPALSALRGFASADLAAALGENTKRLFSRMPPAAGNTV